MWLSLYILGAVAGLAVLFVLVVALRPAEFRITRSATMDVSPRAAFAWVNDFHNWEAWSPWAKIDPAMTRTYEGAEAGTGAVYTWTGNKKVGAGAMTITDSRPNDRIHIDLEFFRPFAARHTVEFTFEPAGGQTVVTWGMEGRNNFFLKAFGLLMNMDKMIGRDFEKGLAAMKAQVEGATVQALGRS